MMGKPKDRETLGGDNQAPLSEMDDSAMMEGQPEPQAPIEESKMEADREEVKLPPISRQDQ
mgnify:CR=1 FL=1